MAGAADFMVGNAPSGASYAAPLIGMALGDRLADLPNRYFQGTQQARTLALQNAFPNGLPTTDGTPNGPIDVNAVMQTLTKLGGAQSAQENLSLLIGMQSDQNVANALRGIAPGQAALPTSYPAPNIPAAGPGHIIGPGNSNAQGGAQANPSGKPPATVPEIEMQGDGSQRNPYRPRNMQDYQDVADGSWFVSPSGQTVLKGRETPAQMTRVAQAAPSNASATTGAGIPLTPTTGASGAPAPPPGNAPETAMPASGIVPSVPPSGAPQATAVDPGLAALLPDGWIESGHTVGKYRDVLAAVAAQRNVSPNAQAVALAKVKAIDDYLARTGEATVQSQLRANEPTEAVKTARAVGMNPLDYAQQQKTNELNAAQYNKMGEGLSGMASTAAGMLQSTIPLAKSVVNQPGFYSGTAEGVNLAWKRAIAGMAATPIGRAMGADPNAPVPQEAFRKIMAAQILHQVDDMKAAATEMGATSSRLFQSQIELMQQAAQNPDNSIAANRYLTELSARTAQRMQVIGDMVDDYKQAHNGRLDAGFDKSLRTWMTKNPLFSKEELANPNLLSAPDAPAALQTKQDASAWAAGVGLREGDPFRRVNPRTGEPEYRFYHGTPATPAIGPATAVAAPATFSQRFPTQ
jgi:hypothetical protein